MLTALFAALGAVAVFGLYKAWQAFKAPPQVNRPSRAANETLPPYEWHDHDDCTEIHLTEETMQEFESLLKGSTNGTTSK